MLYSTQPAPLRFPLITYWFVRMSLAPQLPTKSIGGVTRVFESRSRAWRWHRTRLRNQLALPRTLLPVYPTWSWEAYLERGQHRFQLEWRIYLAFHFNTDSMLNLPLKSIGSCSIDSSSLNLECESSMLDISSALRLDSESSRLEISLSPAPSHWGRGDTEMERQNYTHLNHTVRQLNNKCTMKAASC